jgi:hypothetical protein
MRRLIFCGSLLTVTLAIFFAARTAGKAPQNTDAERTSQRRPRDKISYAFTTANAASAQEPEIASHPPTAKEESSELVRRLQLSGPSTETWTPKARDTFTRWLDSASDRVKTNARINQRGCYRGGCVVDIEVGSSSSHQEVIASFSASEQFHSWKGSKYCSGPVTGPDGNIKTTCVAFRPDE